MIYGYVPLGSNLFVVETENYKITFDTDKGGTIREYVVKKAKNSPNVVFREGIEMYWKTTQKEIDPHVKPHLEEETWDQRHFEQEYGELKEFKCEKLGDFLIVKVKSTCSWTLHPPKYFGETRTCLYFKEELPYVYIEFEEKRGVIPEGVETWFKRYMASPPNIFTHYAKKLDKWAIDNIHIIPNHASYLENDVYVRTPLEIQVEGDPPRHPAAKWLAMFNKDVLFAMIPASLELWRGDDYPISSRSGLFHSWSMDELIYYCRMPCERWRLNMAYFGSPTTETLKYRVIEQQDFNGFKEILNNGLV